jgi:hypothetical protein
LSSILWLSEPNFIFFSDFVKVLSLELSPLCVLLFLGDGFPESHLELLFGWAAAFWEQLYDSELIVPVGERGEAKFVLVLVLSLFLFCLGESWIVGFLSHCSMESPISLSTLMSTGNDLKLELDLSFVSGVLEEIFGGVANLARVARIRGDLKVSLEIRIVDDFQNFINVNSRMFDIC